MLSLPADPVATAALAAAATYIMVAAGVGKKQLTFRVTSCPVCHHTRALCTCRWR